ncbi:MULTISPECIES: DUF4233 domain-containing protein [Nocardiopsis]|uniref:DUF4233 domain-containing protein n=1 Tax=Nocardiopsis sinuspersici TaxID=501010 RepID=A0A1V3C308_9ACTN|nr:MULTISPECIES: DUF4233 domain-containing protein [Nocardiopsis]OOC55028.1 hypothetical protein NOSIN_15445 [Nocardiopsis sinuspersici]
MRVVCAVILVFEVIVIGLFIPVAIALEGMAPALAAGLWGGMAAAALVLSGLQKYRLAHYAAWVLQAAFLFTSFLVSGAVLIAVVFVSLWVTGVIMGRRTDEVKAAHRARAEAEAAREAGEAGGDGDVVTSASSRQTR